MKKINRKPISEKIEELIKEKLIEKGLVNTGKLINSIQVKLTNDGFQIIAEDYFEFLDEKYNITEEVFNSKELYDFIGDYISEEIEKNIE